MAGAEAVLLREAAGSAGSPKCRSLWQELPWAAGAGLPARPTVPLAGFLCWLLAAACPRADPCSPLAVACGQQCPSRSYMDTEQYEDAVRDYEKVYQTEKTKGELLPL